MFIVKNDNTIYTGQLKNFTQKSKVNIVWFKFILLSYIHIQIQPFLVNLFNLAKLERGQFGPRKHTYDVHNKQSVYFEKGSENFENARTQTGRACDNMEDKWFGYRFCWPSLRCDWPPRT